MNEDSSSNFKANLSYTPSDDFLIYGQWAEGFRLGAPQSLLTPSCVADSNGLYDSISGTKIPVPGSVSPDELENFEMGLKTRIADDRISLNASIYRINWDGMPVQTGLACGVSVIVNAGESKSEGVEIESRVLLADNLKLDLSASYSEATLTQDAPGLGAGAVNGADLPGSADFNFSLGLEYDFSVKGIEAFARLDYSYVGEYFSNFTEIGQNAGDYGLVNLKIGGALEDVSADVFINNLLNTDDYTWIESFSSQFGFSRAYQLRPRTIGINLAYQF